jgi:predicted O-linked N-acetylglucosamine transferase (SPINDLY family)/predicted SAM-dependent methyltransferase
MSLLDRLTGRAAKASAPDREQLDAWLREGYDLAMRGLREEGLRRFEQVLEHDPDSPEALHFLGSAAENDGRHIEAIHLLQRAVDARPNDAAFWFALAGSLFNYGRNAEAIAAFQGGLALHPQSIDMAGSMWMALLLDDHDEEARLAVEKARDAGLESLQIHADLGAIYRDHGRIDESIANYRRVIEYAPDDAVTHSNLLFMLSYDERYDARALFAEHQKFATRFARPYVAPPPERAWPRRLRIGYVSGDFRRHVVSFFIEPVLEHHDKERFEVFCYYTHRADDSYTKRLRGLADHWIEADHLGDAELADRIRADRIDILVDLAGHTAYNRLLVFAMKPAPVQVTYLGYPSTTGLAAIDYRITDARADPPGEADAQSAEKLVRMPDCFHCFRPRKDSPAVGPLPAAAAGHVTFGCFNNFTKLSPAFFDAAARVLAAVPGSRLILKGKPLAVPYVAERVRERFARAGIEADRLTLAGWRKTLEDHLAAYNAVDIALDSFPYHGTTTTCEALWMGTPVVTLVGDRHAARVGHSLLRAVGLEDLVTRSVDDYIAKAASLASDLGRLAELRAGLRERVRRSPLTDEVGFTRTLEARYLEMWQALLKGNAAPATTDEETLARIWNQSFDAGNPGAAIDWLNKAIAARGGVAAFHYMLGCSLQAQGKVHDAIGSFARALQLDPQHAKAHNNLGCMLEAAGNSQDALQAYGRAGELAPNLAVSFYNRGNLLRRLGDYANAAEVIAHALAIEPQHAEWHSNLADLHYERLRLDEAIASYRKALELDPRLARACSGLGLAALALGKPAEAEAHFRRALEIEPKFIEAQSNLLLCLHYLRAEERQKVFDEHLRWANRFARGFGWQAARNAEERARRGRLKIGYVSPDFRRHPVAHFIEPVLAAHDRKKFHVFCYSNAPYADETTARLRGLAEEWRDIGGLTDAQVAERMRFDRIDILVDLAGHTGGGRPLLFANKPAPVQATWLGYPGTTGLAAIDYRLTDAHADPAGASEAFYTEELVRLPAGFLCYRPPVDSPAVAPPPSERGGAHFPGVTFGSFSYLGKVMPSMIELWARLLAAVPEARLMLKSYGLSAASARAELTGRFARHGIGAERLVLLPPEDGMAAHLARYGEVDIALDSFPYNGTTTTFEALWMGVPVVTLAGQSHAARVGLSILSRLGLGELAAASAAEYLDKAVALARDAPRRGELRRSLRARLQASPLLDGAGFTRGLEAAYTDMWARFARKEDTSMRLHIGGRQKRPGWKILNIQPGLDVDYVGDCVDLGQFADATVDEIYAAHVLEHLSHSDRLPRTLREFNRVLKPGGALRISVPDFELLCRMFVDPQQSKQDRKYFMQVAFGGQLDEHDFHHVGLSFEFLRDYLADAGFSRVERCGDHGLFHDESRQKYNGVPISLNVVAYK